MLHLTERQVLDGNLCFSQVVLELWNQSSDGVLVLNSAALLSERAEQEDALRLFFLKGLDHSFCAFD
jgi:hypothetical protein